MKPTEAAERIRNLGLDATQYTFCRLIDAKPANFSRYLRGDITQISVQKQEELAAILTDCEALKMACDKEDIPVSFRNPLAVRKLLDRFNSLKLERDPALLEEKMRAEWMSLRG